MTVAMLSIYQSPLKYLSRKVEGNFIHKGITLTVVIVQAWNLYSCLKVQSACLPKDKKMVEFSK